MSLLALRLGAAWAATCGSGQVDCNQYDIDYDKYGSGNDNTGYRPPCGNSPANTCIKCPAGTYVMKITGRGENSQNFSHCAPCPPGRYGNNDGAENLLSGCPSVCPTGKYVKQWVTTSKYDNSLRWLIPERAVLEDAWKTGVFPTTDTLCKDRCVDVSPLDRRCGQTQACLFDRDPSAAKVGSNEIAVMLNDGEKRCTVCETGFHHAPDQFAPDRKVEPTQSLSSGVVTCLANTPCNPGYRIKIAPTNVSDATCEPCSTGYYSGGVNMNCKEWRTCNATSEQMVAEGTTVSDRICIPVPLQGAAGPPGPQGIQGVPGKDGTDGMRGTPGANGTCPSNCRSLKQHFESAENISGMSQLLEDYGYFILAIVSVLAFLLLVACSMHKVIKEKNKVIETLKSQLQFQSTLNRTEKNRNTWDMRSIEQDGDDGRGGVEMQSNPIM